jgi:hypothetical protein
MGTVKMLKAEEKKAETNLAEWPNGRTTQMAKTREFD